MGTKKQEIQEEKEQEVVTFSKEQFLESETLPISKDVLSVVLEEGRTYTRDQVIELANDFLNKEV